MTLKKLREIKELGLTPLTAIESKKGVYVVLEDNAEFYLFKYWKNEQNWDVAIKVKADTNLKEIERIIFNETQSILVSNNKILVKV